MPIKVPRWPLLGDLFDSRAKSRSSDLDLLDVFKVTLPAILGSLLTFGDFAGRLLSSWTSAAIYIQACIPAVLLAVCCHLIMSRERMSAAAAGFARQEAHEEDFYRGSRALRTVAKIALLPLILLTGIELWGILPSRLGGTSHIAGFLCDAASGKPLPGSTVEAFNKLGASVSTYEETADDDGFFFLDLQPWKTRPWYLEAAVPQCRQVISLSLSKPAAASQGCPTAAPAARRPSGSFPVWRIQCLSGS